jgi:hypothetical protein
MSKSIKVIITIILIIVFFILGIFLLNSGTSKTFVGMIGVGLIFGIRSMWKKPSEEITLNKSDDEKDITKK